MTVHDKMCTPIGLQELAKEWWDCLVSDELALSLSTAYIKATAGFEPEAGSFSVPCLCSSGTGQTVWLKNRINDLNLLPVGEARMLYVKIAKIQQGRRCLRQLKSRMWLR